MSTTQSDRPGIFAPRPTRPGRRLPVVGHATIESKLLIGLGVGLLVFGLVMTFSASFVQSAKQSGDAFQVFGRQAFWAAIGLPVAVLAAWLDVRVWRRVVAFGVFPTLAAMLLVLFIGEEINGARRWFTVGPVSIQPSEVVKLTLPVYTAHVVAQRWGRIRRGDVMALLVPALPVTLVAAALVALSPDLESAVLVFAIGIAPLVVAGLPLRMVVAAVMVLVPLAWVSITSSAYRMGRVQAWLDPTSEAFRDGYGYQTTQGFIALGNGGILGVGLGQGRGKWLYIPNAHTDFIYAIIGEETGLVGGLVVLAAFAGLAYLGFRVALRVPDVFASLVAAGITTWLAVQAAINISSVVGVLPVTGVTLPLVSFGGSSLVITMAGIGVLVAIARQVGPTRAVRAGEPDDLDVDAALDLLEAQRRERAGRA